MRPFWNFVTSIVGGQLARAENVNTHFEEVETALAAVATELNRCIRMTYGTPGEGDFQISGNPAANGGKVFALNSAGTGVEFVAKLLNPRGQWVTTTVYSVGDVVQAGAAGSLYYCAIAHTAGTFATDLAAVKWVLILDATTAYQAARAFRIVTNADSPYLASPGDDLFVDVSGGAVTVTLPASPTINMQSISIVHGAGNIASNNLTIGRNGQPLMGLAQDMTVNTTNAALELGFMDSTNGWRLVRGI